ncbi:MAG: ABC transporter ATP-binding protein [Rhodospirillales bacterium]|jgi:branched-chain amino acid transport system ATP-binding protein|uniref:ABC transporter ATP-binding protein n=1 Tax=Hwanghaeella sp. 1Z406 TaxID=3402811 RepID=UPI000C8D048A|nr:ABC transporter ATP-binding protein [Rhodospirillales bacterium]|tara:strand:- start:9449 stop:10201 length:753 start_codon:yes stop_codon:yes gene_type:complete
MSDYILETQGLVKAFGGFTAVKDVALKVRPNTVHALIGPNGAGKTTVFNLLTKFMPPTSGQIFFKGKEITNKTPVQVARQGLVRSFQISAVFSGLTVFENLRVALARPLGLSYKFWRHLDSLKSTDARATELMEAVGLTEFRDIRAADLAYGRKRALELATTLALDPELVLLDEPMAGLGQEDIAGISKLIHALKADRTVIMVEHNLSVVADLSDTITVLQRGEILAEGNYASVSTDKRVVEAYLGGDYE